MTKDEYDIIQEKMTNYMNKKIDSCKRNGLMKYAEVYRTAIEACKSIVHYQYNLNNEEFKK